MNRIRAGRAKPGLMRQHLGCIAAAEISGAQVQGAELNSQSLSFAPGKPRAGDYRFHLGTAGSCGLLLQTLWPALMMANGPSRLSLGGGTHNPPRRRSISWRAATRPCWPIGRQGGTEPAQDGGSTRPAAARSRRGSGRPPTSWSRST